MFNYSILRLVTVRCIGVFFAFLLLLPQPAAAQTANLTPEFRAAALVQLEAILAQLVIIQELIQALYGEASSEALPVAQGVLTQATAMIDYLAEETEIVLGYQGAEAETVIVAAVTEEAVIAYLSEYLGVTEENVQSLLEFERKNALVPINVVFSLESSRSMEVITTRANGTVNEYRIPQSDINEVIVVDFGGLSSLYDALVDGYARELSRGTVPPEVVEFISELTAIPVSTLEPILEIDVSSRYKTNAHS